MKELFDAIMTRLNGSALWADVPGRIYLDEAPPGTPVYPFVVFFIVTGSQQDTFSKALDIFTVQFSLFSSDSGSVEITTMYDDLKAIMDDAVLTMTHYKCPMCVRQSLVTMTEDAATVEATPNSVKHWAVDYEITLEAA